jgi:hypothetical protein
MTEFGVVDLQAVRKALKARLETRVGGWATVYPNDVENPTGIYVSIVAGSPYLGYFKTYGPVGISQMNVVLEIGVGGANAINKQKHIDDMLGIGTDHSIIDAITADSSLGGLVEDIGIGDPSGPDSRNPLGRLPLEIMLRKGGS